MLTYFANPKRLSRALERLQPWLWVAAILAFAAGIYLAQFASPADYQQGEYVRIMYIHVPAAWLALGIYAGMALSSAIFLVWRHPVADVAARESAPMAATMTLITLITGALWGKPTWGTYWVWDARLTSMLLLFCIILGYQMLASQSAYDEKRQKSCAVFCLFGALNLPIIKFSVDWWNTLHQPASILRSGGVAIDSAMLWPLGCMALAYGVLYAALLSLRLRTSLLQAKYMRLRARAHHTR